MNKNQLKLYNEPSSWKKAEKKKAQKKERSSSKNYTHKAEVDLESSDANIISLRPEVCSGKPFKFPLKKFLHSRVGMPWDETYSLFKKDYKADKDYLLIDLIMNSVSGIGGNDNGSIFNHKQFYVDEKGILNCHKKNKHNYIPPYKCEDIKNMLTFLGKNKIRKNGNVYTWMVPKDPRKAIDCVYGSYGYNWLLQPYNQRNWGITIYNFVWFYWGRGSTGCGLGTFNYMPSKKLTDDELKTWNSFPYALREKVLKNSRVKTVAEGSI